MAKKGIKSRLFRRQPMMLLIDERVSNIVLPTLPADHQYEEEDEPLFAEEFIEEETSPQQATPLRVFLGSTANIQEKNTAHRDEHAHIWDVESASEEETTPFERPPPLRGLATLATASIPVEQGFSTMQSDSPPSSPELQTKDILHKKPALASLSEASIPVEDGYITVGHEDPPSYDDEWGVNENILRGTSSPPSTGVATLANAALPVEHTSGVASLANASIPIESSSASSSFFSFDADDFSEEDEFDDYQLEENDFETDEVKTVATVGLRQTARLNTSTGSYSDEDYLTDEDEFDDDLILYDSDEELEEKTAIIPPKPDDTKTQPLLDPTPSVQRKRVSDTQNSRGTSLSNYIIIGMVGGLCLLVLGFFLFAIYGDY